MKKKELKPKTKTKTKVNHKEKMKTSKSKSKSKSKSSFHKKKKKTPHKKNTINKKKSTNKRKKNKYLKPILLEIAFSISLGIVVSLIIFFYICTFETMDGNGMSEAINKGDVALINKHYRELKRFDVISIKGVKRSGMVRIIGLPHESIRYKEDYLYVNEQPVDEKFLVKEINRYNKEGKTFTEGESGDQLLQVNDIPKDHYLVLGDNRPYATDSRYYGLVSKEDIKGKATILVSPLRRIDDF